MAKKSSNNDINVLVGANFAPLESTLQEAAQAVKAGGEQIAAASEKATKASANSFKTLQAEYRSTYRAAQLLAQELGTDSQAFQEAAAQAAKYKDELEDVQDAIKAASPEKKWQLVGSAISNVVDIAQGFVGVLSLIGIESNEAQKYIQAMMSLQAISGAVAAVFQLEGAYKALTAATAASTAAASTFMATIAAPLKAAAAMAGVLGLILGTSNEAGATSSISKKLDLDAANKSLKDATTNATKLTDGLKNQAYEISIYNAQLDQMNQKLAEFRALQASDIDYSGGGQIESKQASFNIPSMQAPDQIKQVVSQFQTVNEEIEITMAQIADTIAMGIESAIAAAASGGDIGKALVSSLLSSMGNFMSLWGAQLILVGLGAEALKASLKSLNGVAAIVAGAALVAAGAGAKAIAANFSGSSSSGGGSSQSMSTANYGSGGGMAANFGGTYFTMDGRVRGQDLIIATSNTNRDNRR